MATAMRKVYTKITNFCLDLSFRHKLTDKVCNTLSKLWPVVAIEAINGMILINHQGIPDLGTQGGLSSV